MRIALWAVAVFALATSLDSSLYDGRHTQAAAQVVRQMTLHFRGTWF
jgi:hypothetical protein